MKHVKFSLILTFIVAFSLGVLLTVANIVYSSSNTESLSTIGNVISYASPVIKSPISDSLVSAGTSISVEAPGAISLAIGVKQYINTTVSSDSYQFERRSNGWYKIESGRDPYLYSTNEFIVIDWKTDKYINGEVKIYAMGYYPNGTSGQSSIRIFVKKDTASNPVSNPTPTPISNSTNQNSTDSTSSTNNTTTSSSTNITTNTNTSTSAETIKPPAVANENFSQLSKEEKKKAVLDYVKQKYPNSVVSDYLDNDQVLNMIASGINNNIRVDKAENIIENQKTKVILKGKAAPDKAVSLYILSDPIIVSTRTNKDGDWEYSLDSISEGKYEVFVTVTENDGKSMKRSEPLSFFISTAQAASVNGGESGSKSNENSFYSTPLFKYSLMSVIVVSIVLLAFFMLLRYEKKNLKKKIVVR